MTDRRRPRAAMFWSGGKDSALALDRTLREGLYEVAALITTVNPEYGRVSMHGVREDLVARQAEAIGIPLSPMPVPSAATNEAYVAGLRRILAAQKAAGVEAVIFGDIFLADLRAWREGFLAESGLAGVFPLWGEDTRRLPQAFLGLRFKAVTCCTDDAWLDEHWVGRSLDEGFFAGLPAGVDPCGENGEYHSFVHDGPLFRHPVAFEMGDRVYRPLGAAPSSADDADDAHASAPRIAAPSPPTATRTKGFWFVDLLPA